MRRRVLRSLKNVFQSRGGSEAAPEATDAAAEACTRAATAAAAFASAAASRLCDDPVSGGGRCALYCEDEAYRRQGAVVVEDEAMSFRFSGDEQDGQPPIARAGGADATGIGTRAVTEYVHAAGIEEEDIGRRSSSAAVWAAMALDVVADVVTDRVATARPGRRSSVGAEEASIVE